MMNQVLSIILSTLILFGSCKESCQTQMDSCNKSSQSFVIFVLGGPGSGKGTQCLNIVKKYPQFRHLSTGDMLRNELTTKSQDAKSIQKYMKEGKLVPSELIVKLIHKVILAFEGFHIFLVDGFPRSEENLNYWNNKILGLEIPIKYVIFFDLPMDVMEYRLLKRAETSGRDDDNPKTIQKRLQTYQNETLPIIDLFHKTGQLLQINSQDSIQKVFIATEQLLKKNRLIES